MASTLDNPRESIVSKIWRAACDRVPEFDNDCDVAALEELLARPIGVLKYVSTHTERTAPEDVALRVARALYRVPVDDVLNCPGAARVAAIVTSLTSEEVSGPPIDERAFLDLRLHSGQLFLDAADPTITSSQRYQALFRAVLCAIDPSVTIKPLRGRPNLLDVQHEADIDVERLHDLDHLAGRNWGCYLLTGREKYRLLGLGAARTGADGGVTSENLALYDPANYPDETDEIIRMLLLGEYDGDN